MAGAIAASHPLATAAGQEMLTDGGSAVDAVIAAQAVLCVVAPDACGLGGDATALVRTPAGVATAVLGSFAGVAGIVDAWDRMHARWSRLTLPRLLRPAIRLARGGLRASPALASLGARMPVKSGGMVEQLELAQLLDRIAKERAAAFYTGLVAEALVRAARSGGGALSLADLAAHRTRRAACVQADWWGGRVLGPPIPHTGVLASGLAGLPDIPAGRLDPAGVRLTPSHVETAQPAVVAAADRFGLTVAAVAGHSAAAGVGVYVPEAGILSGGGAAPILLPILLETPRGPLAFASGSGAPGFGAPGSGTPGFGTPGFGAPKFGVPASGDPVPALLQVLAAALEGADLATAMCRPRRDLGGVVCAGHIDDEPLCVADAWRDNWAGVA